MSKIHRTNPIIPPTTPMVFYMAAAPVGWTIDGSNNDKALRVVSSGGGGSGGTHGLSSPPATGHTHPVSITSGINSAAATLGGGGAVLVAADPHDHLVSGSTTSGSPTVFAPQYIDIIICTKD
jgi:hypothetical protein